jgi:hypothetical protein
MATITATPTNAPRTGSGFRDRVRATWHRAVPQVATAASTVRRRLRRPVLVVGSFTCGVASAWTTFGLGAGLLAMFAAGLALEFISSEDEDDS